MIPRKYLFGAFSLAVLFLFSILSAQNILIQDASTTQNKTAEALTGDVEDFCHKEGSLHNLALQMAKFSTPSARAKTLRTLQASPYFRVYLPHDGIFRNVAENMQTLLQGFGLKPWKENGKNNGFLFMEVSYYARNTPDYLCTNGALNCSAIPRIILQSEQLEQVGEDYLSYLKDCHLQLNCVIWDFSDYHLDWAKKHNFSDSVLLLPVMHQSLLGPYDKETALKPIYERPLDVVFLGSLKDRRKALGAQMNQTHPAWKQVFSFSLDTTWIQQSYANAKICLILHSYANHSAGEYHRLNELAGSGCVPIVERFADSLGKTAYRECGGLVQAHYHQLVHTIDRVLEEINKTSRQSQLIKAQEQRVLWWNQKIHWDGLLSDIYGTTNRSSASTSSGL